MRWVGWRCIYSCLVEFLHLIQTFCCTKFVYSRSTCILVSVCFCVDENWYRVHCKDSWRWRFSSAWYCWHLILFYSHLYLTAHLFLTTKSFLFCCLLRKYRHSSHLSQRSGSSLMGRYGIKKFFRDRSRGGATIMTWIILPTLKRHTEMNRAVPCRTEPSLTMQWESAIIVCLFFLLTNQLGVFWYLP